MIILIVGASHTGKTALAQKNASMLDGAIKYNVNYVLIDDEYNTDNVCNLEW